MNIVLKISLLLLLVFQLFLIIRTVKKKRLTMKYASFWIFLIILMTIVVIFPEIVFKNSKLAGFKEPSNMVFLLGFFFLFYVSFIITTSISIQNEKTKLLIQEISMLKESVNKNGKKDEYEINNYVCLLCAFSVFWIDSV